MFRFRPNPPLLLNLSRAILLDSTLLIRRVHIQIVGAVVAMTVS